jgi:hypothetical protein
MVKLKLSLLFVLAAWFSLSACAAGNSKQGNVDQRGFVQTSAKKGGSGVDVAYRIDGRPQPNTPVRITVEFKNVNAPDGASATFAAEAPLVLAGPSTLTLASGQTASTTLTVTAPADGTYFVNVTTRQAGRPTTVSIPVTVGAGGVRLQKQGTVQTTPSGEKVISLPSK